MQNRKKMFTEGIDNHRDLFSAVVSNDVAGVKRLLDNGANPDAWDSMSSWNILMLASEAGYLEIVKLLVDYGADVNDKGDDGKTAVVVASLNGHNDVVNFLVKSGAKIKKIKEADMEDLFGSDTHLPVPQRFADGLWQLEFILTNMQKAHQIADWQEREVDSQVEVITNDGVSIFIYCVPQGGEWYLLHNSYASGRKKFTKLEVLKRAILKLIKELKEQCGIMENKRRMTEASEADRTFASFDTKDELLTILDGGESSRLFGLWGDYIAEGSNTLRLSFERHFNAFTDEALDKYLGGENNVNEFVDSDWTDFELNLLFVGGKHIGRMIKVVMYFVADWLDIGENSILYQFEKIYKNTDTLDVMASEVKVLIKKFVSGKHTWQMTKHSDRLD